MPPHNPFQYPRRAAPPLMIPTPPKVARLARPTLPPGPPVERRPCGFCGRVRRLLRMGSQ